MRDPLRSLRARLEALEKRSPTSKLNVFDLLYVRTTEEQERVYNSLPKATRQWLDSDTGLEPRPTIEEQLESRVAGIKRLPCGFKELQPGSKP